MVSVFISKSSHKSGPSIFGLRWRRHLRPKREIASDVVSDETLLMFQMQQHIRILAGIMIVLSLATCLLASPTSRLLGHSVQKRSFYDLQCKGVYDKSIFARLDLICDDCYNLFREPQLHQLCRWVLSTIWISSCRLTRRSRPRDRRSGRKVTLWSRNDRLDSKVRLILICFLNRTCQK